jgi:GT2 family glycosyltransferase
MTEPVVDVSVVVSTVGRPRELARCVKALLAAAPAPAQVIVVDQSADGSAPDLPRPLTYLRIPDEGVSRARNRGAAAALHDVLAFTDDDCVAAANWVAALRVAYADAAVDGVTGRVLPLLTGRDGVAVSSRTSRARRVFSGTGSIPWEIGTGGNLSLRRAVFERLGGFDEALGPGTSGRAAEDVDLLYRSMLKGCTVVYEPDAIVYHERKSRRARLGGRFGYGYGMGTFLDLHARRGDLHARELRRRYARGLARAAVSGVRHGDVWPAVDGVLTYAGLLAASAPHAHG